MPKDIAILLATYNSESFLSEQLDSLFNQTYQEWTLYIRDDGSKDNTMCLIQKYQEKYPQRIIIINDLEYHIGPMNSFMRLLEKINADYYMFCDHDDVWLPHKIEISLNKMYEIEKQNPQLPIIIHTDLQVVNQQLNKISASFWKYSKLKPHILKKFNYIGVCNCVTGCTMLLNKYAKIIAFPYPPYAPMHDWWIAAKVAKLGKIVEIPTPTILYRQHMTNKVGARNIAFMYFIHKIIDITNTLKGHKELFPFHKSIGYGSIAKYYLYKILYTIRRNF